MLSPVKSSNPIGTFAMSRGNIITNNIPGSSTPVEIQPYLLEQWYIVRKVINLDKDTFDFYVENMNVPKLSAQSLRTTNRDSLDRFVFF